MADDSTDPDPLRTRLLALESRAGDAATAYRAWRRRYEALHYALGVPAAALAAAVGVAAFADNVSKLTLGLLALASALLTAAATVLKPDRQSRFNRTQEFHMARIENDAATLRSLTRRSMTEEQAISTLAELDNRYYETQSRVGD
jgi:peptidoglycan/LPS O-acetylase OafA/YrhL